MRLLTAQPEIAEVPCRLLDGIEKFCMMVPLLKKGSGAMTFGEKLQSLRQKAGMSQDVLAEKLDVSRQAVSRWERNETMPETEKVILLADLFGVTTDYLLRPEVERQEPIRREKSNRFLTEHLGTLARILGWAAVAWGALDLLGILNIARVLWY